MPSTILWRRSLEDLHVNSLFQRLRRNLLLFLQLLAVALAMLALAGPRMKGSSGQGQRFVLLIDNSASMAATDVAPSRLAKAKEAAKKVVSEMDADDLAMVITFADSAQVVSNYTGDRRALLQRIDSIEPSQSTTSLREGLQVAAGLANPSKQIGEGVVASSVVTPKLFIYTDGGFADVEGFSLGNLEPEVVVIGPAASAVFAARPRGPPLADGKARARNPSDNVAILALQTRRDEDKPEVYQLFGRVHNYPRRRGRAPRPSSTATRPTSRATKAPWSTRSRSSSPRRATSRSSSTCPTTGLTPYEVRLTVKDALDARQSGLHGRRHDAKGPGAGDHGRRPLPDRHAQDPIRRRTRRRHDLDPGGGQERSGCPRREGRPLRPGDLSTGSSPTRPPKPTRFISASFLPGRLTPSPRRSSNRSSSTGTSPTR